VQIVEAISASIRAADAQLQAEMAGVLFRAGPLRFDILHFALASVAAMVAFWHFSPAY